MAYKMVFIFCSVLALVIGEDNRKLRNERKSKFISFDATKNDIEVSLDFNVPFLSIPIKNTINSMLDGPPGLGIPKININPTALAFGSFIVLATSVLLPLFSKSFIHETDRYYRVLDKGSEETNILMDFTNQFMSVSRGCPLRIACWMGQRSDDLAPTKTVQQIIRNKLMSSIFNTSSIEDAVKDGRRGRDCATYGPCPIREEHLPMIMRNFDILTTGNLTDTNIDHN